MSAPLPSSQSRSGPKIDLQDHIDRILEGDRRYFLRHVDRSVRIRLAGSAEIRQLADLRDVNTALPTGRRWYVLIEQIVHRPGVQRRIFGAAPEGFDCDLDEEACRHMVDGVLASAKRLLMIEDCRG